MLDLVAATIIRYLMFEPGQKAGIAVSGGADSVCLLDVLRELAPRWNLRLHVLHLDHGIRAEASRQDAEFVRKLAAQLGFPFHLKAVKLSAATRNLEQSAREARIEFFTALISDGVVDRIALGHTRSDQAETVLFRLLRGAGTTGLAGVRPVTSNGFVRPLIELPRDRILAYLKERGLEWREDATNRHTRFARNRIRHELLPYLGREWNPQIMETLAQIATLAQEDEAYWEALIRPLEGAVILSKPPAVLFKTGSLEAHPPAIRRRLIRRAVEMVKGNLLGVDFDHIDGILRLAEAREGDGRLQVTGLDVFRSFDWVRLAPGGSYAREHQGYHLNVNVPGEVVLPGGGEKLRLELFDPQAENQESSSTSRYNGIVFHLDWSKLSGGLEIRNWRPGDRIRLAGQTREEKVKFLFQERRVPLWERRHWPVMTTATGTLVWVGRFGAAEQFAARETTRTVLRICEQI